MNFVRVGLLLAITFISSGCQKRYWPGLDIDTAILHSPKGDFELKLGKDERKWHEDVTTLYGHDGIHSFQLNVFPYIFEKSKSLVIMSNSNKSVVKLNPSATYYQLNDGKKISLDVTQYPRPYPHYFSISPPHSMAYYSIDGDGMHVTKNRQKIDWKHVIKTTLDTYRYYISLTIDNEDYAIEVKFRLNLSSTLRFGVVAMP